MFACCAACEMIVFTSAAVKEFAVTVGLPMNGKNRVSTSPAMPPTAADCFTVLVNRRAAGIAAESQRQRRLLNVGAWQRRELDAVQRAAGLKINSRWKVFLKDEARSARGERVAARAEKRGGSGFRNR